MAEFRLGPATVGDTHPAYVIAEAGANHNRDFDVARRLIDVAADAGANAVKFQTYSGATLYSTKTPRFDYLGELGALPAHELLESIALPRDWQAPLSQHASDRGIEFLSSPFDRQAVDELDALDVAAFKIASFEIVDHGLLAYAASKGRPVILSTGMCTLAEVDEAIAVLRSNGCGAVALLQCASMYPAPAHIMNLRSIAAMRSAFDVPVGLSDHTTGIHIASAAVAMGATLIEKHFTLDRSMSGPDHPFAIEPKELAEMVAQIRDVEAALGDGVKRGPSAEESAEMYSKARRSLVAACTIPAGTKITESMLCVKRPGYGIAPRMREAVLGRVAQCDIEYDEILTWDLVA